MSECYNLYRRSISFGILKNNKKLILFCSLTLILNKIKYVFNFISKLLTNKTVFISDVCPAEDHRLETNLIVATGSVRRRKCASHWSGLKNKNLSFSHQEKPEEKVKKVQEIFSLKFSCHSIEEFKETFYKVKVLKIDRIRSSPNSSALYLLVLLYLIS